MAGAFLVLMVGYGAAYSFAAFADRLEADFGGSHISVSVVYGITGCASFMLSAPAGVLTDRFGPRCVAAVGMALVGLGLLGTAAAQSLMQVYLSYGLVIGLGIALSYVPAIAAVQRWFVARRGLASGIAASGIGVGTALVPLLADWLGTLGDWRVVFMVCGAGAALVGVAGAALLSASPEAEGVRPEGGETPAATLEGPLASECLRTRGFVAMYLGAMLVSMPVALPFAHLVRTAQDMGLAKAEALTLLTAVGLASILGRFVVGALSDRLGRRRTFLGCCIGVAATMALWAVAANHAEFETFALLFGVANGAFVALLPAFVADTVGRRATAGVIGILFTGRGLGLLVATPALGLLAELAGGYRAPLALAAAVGALGAMLLASVPRQLGPSRGAGEG